MGTDLDQRLARQWTVAWYRGVAFQAMRRWPLVWGTFFCLAWALSNPSPQTLLCSAWMWWSTALVAAVIAALEFLGSRQPDSQFWEHCDRSLGARGLLLAARPRPLGQSPFHFAPLLTERWQRFPNQTLPRVPHSAVVPWLSLVAMLALAVTAFLVPTHALAASEPITASSPQAPSAESDQTTPEPNPEIPLSDCLTVAISTARRIYLPTEFIDLDGRIEVRAGRGSRVPLAIILLVADGTLSGDKGFGPGVRPVLLPDSPTLPPAAPSEDLTFRVRLDEVLSALEMNRPGFISLQAVVVPSSDDPDDAVDQVWSAEWTIRLAENRASDKVRQDSPVQPQKGGPESKPDSEDSKLEGEGGSDAEPPTGPPEDLGEFETTPEAMEAEANDGPEVEKEVKVFDRQRGEGAPPPPLPPVPVRDPVRLSRQAEQSQHRLDLPPRERSLLQAYFELLRSQR